MSTCVSNCLYCKGKIIFNYVHLHTYKTCTCACVTCKHKYCVHICNTLPILIGSSAGIVATLSNIGALLFQVMNLREFNI